MKAVILCAGKGTRMAPYTTDVPKPMVPVNGVPILKYIVDHCRKHGITQLAINTSHLGEVIRDYFGDGSDFGVSITYSYEPELLGTAGALNNFRSFCDESFFVIYGDSIFDLDLTNMMAYHRENSSDFTLAVRKKEWSYNTQSYIDCGDDMVVKQFLEKPSSDVLDGLEMRDYKYINSGIYLCEPSVLDVIGSGFSDFGFDVIPKAISDGLRVVVYDMKDAFFREVGTPEKLAKAERDLQ